MNTGLGAHALGLILFVMLVPYLLLVLHLFLSLVPEEEIWRASTGAVTISLPLFSSVP